MRYDFDAPPSRDFVIGLLRAHLTDGGCFPSAAMGWLSKALYEAGDALQARDPRHAELLLAAASHVRVMATGQRMRDDAHYADVAPHASADDVVNGDG